MYSYKSQVQRRRFRHTNSQHRRLLSNGYCLHGLSDEGLFFVHSCSSWRLVLKRASRMRTDIPLSIAEGVFVQLQHMQESRRDQSFYCPSQNHHHNLRKTIQTADRPVAEFLRYFLFHPTRLIFCRLFRRLCGMAHSVMIVQREILKKGARQNICT